MDRVIILLSDNSWAVIYNKNHKSNVMQLVVQHTADFRMISEEVLLWWLPFPLVCRWPG